MSESTTGYVAAELKGQLIRTVVAGVVALVVAIAVAAWAIIETLPGKVGLVHSGTVAAFDLKEGCPSGWSVFHQASGRFIIGAVAEDKVGEIPGDFRVDSRGVDLSSRPFGRPGGEEAHQLTEAEMPSHSHEVKGLFHIWDEGISTDATAGDGRKYTIRSVRPADSGGDEAHNNIPPFAALFYCRKD